MQLSLLFHQNPLLQVLNYILSVHSPKILQTIKGDLICLAHVEKKMVCYLISQIKKKKSIETTFFPQIFLAVVTIKEQLFLFLHLMTTSIKVLKPKLLSTRNSHQSREAGNKLGELETSALTGSWRSNKPKLFLFHALPDEFVFKY